MSEGDLFGVALKHGGAFNRSVGSARANRRIFVEHDALPIVWLWATKPPMATQLILPTVFATAATGALPGPPPRRCSLGYLHCAAIKSNMRIAAATFTKKPRTLARRGGKAG